jgi:flagellar biosynthesis protein FlhA
MSNNKKSIGTLGYSIITMVLIGVFIFPIPVMFIDFLLILNFMFSFVLLLDILLTQKQRDYSWIPSILFIFAIVNLAINVILTRQILAFGEEVDSRVMLFLSVPLLDTGYFGLIAGFIFASACILANFVLMKKTKRYIQDECEKIKTTKTQETDFYEEMEGINKFIFEYEKLRWLFIFINSAGGYFIGTAFRNEIQNEIFLTYAVFAVGSCFITVIPAILLTIAVRVIIKKILHYREKTND